MSDIFVSFAHVDDKPVANQQQGWITHFTNDLRGELNRRMGRKENYSFWKDFRLQGKDAVTSEIEQQVTQANTLVILFSMGWLASPWCQKELELFLRSHPDVKGRIFVVELERFRQEDKPTVMQDLLNYPFWRVTDQDRVLQLGYPVPQATDSAYYERLVYLSHDLANTLKALQASITQLPEPPKATVYVAPVDYPLYSQRSNLISELKQFGIAALPAANTPDPNIDANLAQCSHFVQLLDANWTMGIPFNQHLIAEVAKKPILQWRDPKLDYSGGHVPEEQLKLLEGKTVIAAPLADFIRMVRETVLPKDPPVRPPKPGSKKMVFVHTGQEDFERARCVANTLRKNGYGIALPNYQGDAGQIRKSMELGYQFGEVLLFLQQETSANVIVDFLAEALTQALKRENKPSMLICQGDNAEELFFIPAGMQTLVCNSEFDEHCLEQFLAEVEA